ncbi:MAG: hypothetical protein KDD47_13795, partial [Acidobacteria bacterium]|nr:hypothetical protein [Acidobacteriota bacterium]
YALGMEIDLASPPSDTDEDLGAAALGGPTSGGPPLPVGAAPPPPLPGVNLIDPFMPPIRDQADRGTCVAFTAMSCLEYHHRRFGTFSGADLSEQFAYWNMVTSTGHRNLVSMFPLLAQDGSCREGKWPYYPKPISGNDAQGPPPPGARRRLRPSGAVPSCNYRHVLSPRSNRRSGRAVW